MKSRPLRPARLAIALIPSGTGSRLVTEESQHGFMTLRQKVFVPNKLHRLHDVWLAQIKKRAEAVATPSPRTNGASR
jgi:hypothetical protein